MSQKRFVIIDGNAIVHRAYHAMPPLMTRTGELVNAVYGFTAMLLKVLDTLKPTHLAVSFDLAGPTFRHEKFAAYKATRVKADQELYDQFPRVKEVVRAFNIPIYEISGYEADDVIGTIAEKVKTDRDIEVYIVTGDKDTFQLIDKNVKVFALRQGISDTVTYDEKMFQEKFGFRPAQMVDFKALRGDPSDNIPGIPGVGEKTATDLIRQFGTVKKLYTAVKKNPDILKPALAKKIIDGQKSAEMSYELAEIDRTVSDLKFALEATEVKDFAREKIIKLFQDLEFNSLLKRVPGVGAGLKKTGEKNKKVKKSEFNFTEIKTAKDLKELEDKIKSAGRFAARAVFTGDEIYTGRLDGLVVVVGSDGYFLSAKLAYNFFDFATVELVGHNLKDLIKILQVHKKIIVKNILFDIQLASYLLNPGTRAHDDASIVLKILGEELKSASRQDSLFGVDARALSYDLFLLSLTRDRLASELDEVNNLDLLLKLEGPLSRVLARMELNGIAVDKKYLAELSRDLAERVKKITAEIYEMSGEEFNISSNPQLREVLFEKMAIPTGGIKKGKTGLSTSASELEKLHGQHPIIEKIEEYREYTKLQNTYVDVLPNLVNPVTHRVHTTFNQTTTATGRLSSSDPNIQNIPIRTEFGRQLRQVFIAEKGNLLLSADYSQIELRIVASLAEDKKMLEIFTEDKDIHTATAAIINSVSMDKVTREMRRSAKEVNFGVLYGMGAFGLAARTGLSQYEAQDFIDRYFRQFSGVKKYLDTTLAFTKKTGYCETLFGRRRYIPELTSGNWQLRAAGERMAINHPVQGTAADLIKMAMIALPEKLVKYGDKVRMLLQVHDELVFEVAEKIIREVDEVVKEIMEGVVKLRVPIKVETHQGKNWGK